MTADVALTASEVAQQVNRTKSDSSELNKNFNEFLTLLTAQLQNQDPLDPTDSTEFTNQLVQFSQVEQGINTNQKLDLLINNALSTGTGSALGYVGLDVTYSSAELPYNGADPVEFSYFMPEGAVEATLNIRDADGNVIYSKPVNAATGRNDLTWNGETTNGTQAEGGSYAFSIDALDSADDPVQGVSTIVTGRVHGVESQDGITFLLVGERAVQVGSVIQAKQPPASNTDTTDTTDTNNDNTDNNDNNA